MSHKRGIDQVIEEDFEENKKIKMLDERPKRKVTLEPKKYKDYIQFEDSLSESLSSLSLEDSTTSSEIEEIEEEYNQPYLDIDDYKHILEDENEDENQLKELNKQLIPICDQLKEKRVTLTKILQSNLQSYEKEKAVELFGVLYSMHDTNTLEYIQLNKTLYDMIYSSFSQKQDQMINKKLIELHDKMISDTPTLDKIMNASISNTDRMMAIEQFNIFYNIGLCHSGLYSQEWFVLRKKINDLINRKINKQEYEELEKKEEEIKSLDRDLHDLKRKILNLDADLKIKKHIYHLYEDMNHCESESKKEFLTHKLNFLVQLPYNKVLNLNYDCIHIYNQLNKKLYGMVQVKEQMLLHINNKQYNKTNNKIISLTGLPGIGKTRLVKVLAEACHIPLEKISFGGSIDSSILLGSHSVWSNSTPSIILQMLARHHYSNIIILLDEIDKLGSTVKGIEVQNALLQILDYTQNNQFNDAYIEDFPHDLSRIWFIATMNDDKLLSQPLRDRLDIIKLPGYNKEEMVKIIMNHTIVDACEQCGLTTNDLTIDEGACYLLLQYINKDIKESGMRLIEQQLSSIVSKISFLNHHKNLSLSFKLNDFNGYPYVITKSTIKALIIQQHDDQHYKHMYL